MNDPLYERFEYLDKRYKKCFIVMWWYVLQTTWRGLQSCRSLGHKTTSTKICEIIVTWIVS